jgi:hypothetical protein
MWSFSFLVLGRVIPLPVIFYLLIYFTKIFVLSRKKGGAKFFFREGDSPDYLLRPLNPSLVSKRECIAKITRR